MRLAAPSVALSLFFPALLHSVGCGGTVVFEEDGGDGGAGSTSTSSQGPTTSGPASTGPGQTASTVGPGVGPATTVTSSSGPGTGICGSGVSLFDGSQDACIGEGCCDLFQQCSLDGTDPAGCDVCIDQGGGPRCADALRCVRKTGCFSGTPTCANGFATGDPITDECLFGNCCVEGLLCTQGGNDPDGCLSCIQEGGGPQCSSLLQCAEQQGCFFSPEGICDTGITTGDSGIDVCLSQSCCTEYQACIEGDVGECLDCLNSPDGGPVCDAALSCSLGRCGYDPTP